MAQQLTCAGIFRNTDLCLAVVESEEANKSDAELAAAHAVQQEVQAEEQAVNCQLMMAC